MKLFFLWKGLDELKLVTNELRNQLHQASDSRNEAYGKKLKSESRLKNLQRKYGQRITFLQEEEKRQSVRVKNAYVEAYSTQQDIHRKKTKGQKRKPGTTPDERREMKKELNRVAAELKILTGKIKSAEDQLAIDTKRYEIEQVKFDRIQSQFDDSKKVTLIQITGDLARKEQMAE